MNVTLPGCRVFADDRVKMSSVAWALIQHEWWKREVWTQRPTHTEGNDVNAQGEKQPSNELADVLVFYEEEKFTFSLFMALRAFISISDFEGLNSVLLFSLFHFHNNSKNNNN